MRNLLLTDLLSYGVQTIGENNGKYTFLLLTSDVGVYVCPPLFDQSITVGSFIVAKVFTGIVDSTPQYDTAVLVACNFSSKNKTSISYSKNNIFWEELTNVGLMIKPDNELT